MKRFSQTVVQIKNADGDFEPIAALRGLSSYELAVQNGFEGTEDEWLELMLGDGWVGKYQELEAGKANKTDVYPKEDVYTKSESLSSDAKTELGLSSETTPSDAFLALKGIFDSKIVYDAYDGNGTMGVDNPITLEFDFVPRLVCIAAPNSDGKSDSCLMILFNPYAHSIYAGNGSSYPTVTWNENSVSWYDDSPSKQMNEFGRTYHYMAIGCKSGVN